MSQPCFINRYNHNEPQRRISAKLHHRIMEKILKAFLNPCTQHLFSSAIASKGAGTDVQDSGSNRSHHINIHS